MEKIGSNLIKPNFWEERRVLITGHTGFKGSWLSLWLSELGANVTGVGLEPDSITNLFDQLNLQRRLRSHHVEDIRNSNILNDIVVSCEPEVVIHLAAQPLVRKSYREPINTWSTNVMGSLYLLEALMPLKKPCAVVMVTTDKVYENREWVYGYREEDRIGGCDPYSASKAAAELAINSWRSSFCGKANHQNRYLSIATARAGNVIGGGDWAEDRIIPDAIRALASDVAISVRNPTATRPWQHVLEPLGGYLQLAEKLLTAQNPPCEAFNFGPPLESNKSVKELLNSIISHWPGEWIVNRESNDLHEAGLLNLQIDKAKHHLGWKPRWNYNTTIERTVNWYRAFHNGVSPIECCLEDLNAYNITDS